MISRLNHTTLSVKDLNRFFRFYTEELGRPVARWYKGAYLLAGPTGYASRSMLKLAPDRSRNTRI